MTEEETKAAAVTAEVFAETFMRLLKERLKLVVIPASFGHVGSNGPPLTNTLHYTIRLVDAANSEAAEVITEAALVVTYQQDSWGRPSLTFTP